MATPPFLRVVGGSAAPKPETWADRPDHTLVTFTLSKQTVDGCMHGVRNLLDANRNMMLALDAAQAGDVETADKRIQFALADVASASAFAASLYEDVQRSARRANRRRGRA